MPTTLQVKRGPTNPIGVVAQPGWGGSTPGWTALAEDREWVPDLQWPNSVKTYEMMISDSQLGGLFTGTILPIMRYKWTIDPNGARDEIVEGLAKDMNLDVKGEDPRPRGRSRGRFNHWAHMLLALDALVFGHAYFEQVGEIGLDGLWHLRKLMPLYQPTIFEINAEADGGIKFIKQNIGRTPMGQAPEIPIERMVVYLWGQKYGPLVGRPIIRDCYRNWLVKDRLIRVDAINHERAGGNPVVEAPPGANEGEIAAYARLASLYRAGEDTGTALPYGATLKLPRSGNSNVIESIRYHDEAMARRFLMMFAMLGQNERGSYALADSFVDFFSIGQQSVAEWYAETVNMHVIEDWVDWNYGEDEEQCPLLNFELNEDDRSLPIADLVSMVDKGLIVVDDELEETLRERHNLPKKGTPREPETPPAPIPATQTPAEEETPSEAPPPAPGTTAKRPERTVSATVVGAPSLPLPARPLRRQPYDHEIQATTDFAALESAWETEVTLLVSEWQQIRAQQANELRDAIIAAGDNLKKIANIQASPAGASMIAARMLNLANSGAIQAMQEATRQGVAARLLDLSTLAKAFDSRAGATEELLADALSDSARRKAVSLTGGSLTSVEVADAVRTHLLGLTNQYLEEQFGGVLMAGQNAGRKLAMKENDADRIYSSELLDTNTCDPCKNNDGKQYGDMEAAEKDYPTGGFKSCKGGPRCRGTLVAVYDESPATVM